MINCKVRTEKKITLEFGRKDRKGCAGRALSYFGKDKQLQGWGMAGNETREQGFW